MVTLLRHSEESFGMGWIAFYFALGLALLFGFFLIATQY